MNRLPSLDGLRAVSILSVIVGHIALTRQQFVQVAFLGLLGVKVFFVISGFLITTLLKREFETTGRISLGGFYKRRALRIFPLAYFYLFVIVVLASSGVILLNKNDVLASALYMMSYHQLAASPPVRHLWSLSVEEQFYFLWPPLIALIGLRRAPLLGLLVATGMPIIRMLVWLLLPNRHYLFSLQMLSSVDAVAIGCLGALWSDKLASVGSRIRDWMMVVAGAVLLLVVAYPLESLPILIRRSWRAGQDSFAHVLILLLLAGAVYGSRGVVFRVLNSQLMVWIGVLSYSLYIWQELFIMYSRTHPIVAIVLTFAVAWVAHLTIEKPFLRLKRRYGGPAAARAMTAS